MSTTAPAINTETIAGNSTDHSSETAQAPGAPVSVTASENYRGFAISSFVLGVVSIASGWIFLVPLTGLVLGLVALRKQTSERTLTIWGVVLNGAMLLVSLLAVALLALLFFSALAVAPLSAESLVSTLP